MESLASLFEGFEIKQTSKARNEREELIEKFQKSINAERIGTKYKELSFLAVKLKVSHLDNFELYRFYRMCESSRSGFGKCFFGALKVK